MKSISVFLRLTTPTGFVDISPVKPLRFNS